MSDQPMYRWLEQQGEALGPPAWSRAGLRA